MYLVVVIEQRTVRGVESGVFSGGDRTEGCQVGRVVYLVVLVIEQRAVRRVESRVFSGGDRTEGCQAGREWCIWWCR